LAQYDGALRVDINRVWLARSGYVGLGRDDEVLYYTEDRPEHAPDEARTPYWNFTMWPSEA
jgi:hypothetical protein